MSSSIHHYSLLILFFAVAIFSVSSAAKFKQPKPTAFLFPIRKDTKTLQYYTELDISSQGNYVKLVLDIGGLNTWLICDAKAKILSTSKSIDCNSKKCKTIKGGCMRCGPDPTENVGCTDDGCGVSFGNPFITDRDMTRGLREDDLFVKSTNGLSVGLTYKAPEPFPFSCVGRDENVGGLSNETNGVTGLMNTPISLHAQLSTQFKLPHKFALCLPSTSDYILGHMFIGGRPYIFPPYKDIGRELITAKLVTYPVRKPVFYELGDIRHKYFIVVKSISVDHKHVSFNASLLSFNKHGIGGTTFSTVTPFTKLESSIYESLVGAFTKAAAARKMKRVSSVAPFGACYKAKSIAKSQTGPVVPYIDIGLAGGNQHWRFYGANSMVSVNKDVLCLAFVDGGMSDVNSLIIGAHQMENYLIEFDLVTPKVGISTSLLFRNTTCSQSRLM